MRDHLKLRRPGKCWRMWMVVCCLILSCVPLAEAEEENGMISLQYIQDGVPFQPVVIQANDEIDIRNLDLYFDQTGYVSPVIWQYLSPRLTDNYEVIDIDVSEKRILLCLSKNDKKFLRIAQWDTALHDYTIIDTGLLPALIELDTYHDGNAVLLLIPSVATTAGQETELQEDECLFLTFQQVENSWYLTDFTDGQSFTATLSNNVYLFEDYDEPDPEHVWTTHDIIDFANFSITEYAAK